MKIQVNNSKNKKKMSLQCVAHRSIKHFLIVNYTDNIPRQLLLTQKYTEIPLKLQHNFVLFTPSADNIE